MKLKTIKAQQETVGFVIIILLIMIIGTIFLGIWLRSSKNTGVYAESKEMNDFLSASLSQTTECYRDSLSDLKTLGKLIEYCDKSGEIYCPNDENACSYLNRTYSAILPKFKPAGILGYYKLNIYFKQFVENNTESGEDTNEITPKNILEIVQGSVSTCSIKRGGFVELNADGGSYVVNFESCESKIE